MAVVLYQEEMGVYLGSCLGLGFWSKWDAAGQDEACVFSSSAQAAEYVKTWDNIPEGIHAVIVNVPNTEYASMEACVAAGLPAWEID
jgi:hypothetical protein